MTMRQICFVKADAVDDARHVEEVAVFDEDGTPLDPPGSGEGATISDGSVTTAKLAAKAVTKEKIADGVIPTVPGKATSSTDGLMSKEDKAKLDGVANNANNYTLPAATTGALGGVKQVAHVADPAAETPTKAEYIALRDALVTAGIMASA